MPAPPSPKPTRNRVVTAPARRRQTNQWLIVGVFLALFAVVLLIAGWDVFSTPDNQVAATPRHEVATLPQTRDRSQTARSDDLRAREDAAASDDSWLVNDDGQTLWASPTAGKPLDLAYLPSGVQIIVGLRPAALLQHAEGEKVLAALGPGGELAIRYLEDVAQVSPRDIEYIVCGCRAAAGSGWQTTIVVRLVESSAADVLAKRPANAVRKEHGGKAYWLADERAYYVPEVKDSKVLVVAPADAIAELIELNGSPPPLRRDVERLASHTDADRHVTVIVAPNFLFGEGQSMFSGEMSRLRAPLFWFLGDELSAAALSLHWDDNFFVELSAAPTLDTSPQRAAKIIAERVEAMPDKLEEYVVGLEAQPYGRRVVARFPGMVRKLAAYMRSGVESDHAVLRAYLPAVAGHNLLMAAELTLAEPPDSNRSMSDAASASRPVATASSPVEDALNRVTSLVFARDTLEAALEQLSQDIGVKIVIVGPDLQAEGITKNQSFGIDIRDKPAGEILVEILWLANPDKTAAGPSDERQKLLYVIGPAAAGNSQQIQITTRAAAVQRGDALPPVFVAKQP